MEERLVANPSPTFYRRNWYLKLSNSEKTESKKSNKIVRAKFTRIKQRGRRVINQIGDRSLLWGKKRKILLQNC